MASDPALAAVDPDVAALLAPLRDEPSEAAVLTDFDGTLAPIVTDPATARPLDGAAPLLARLAARFGLVAVISGRPVSFLMGRLGAQWAGVVLSGLYGLEWLDPTGEIAVDPEAEPWRARVEDVSTSAAAVAPAGLVVEHKGLSVTFHWRAAPETEAWAQAWAGQEAARTGLVAHAGKMSVELRPPVMADKGTVVAKLVAGRRAACFLGDDLGDLPAFAVLKQLSGAGGFRAVRLAVDSPETPREVVALADAAVKGPAGALAVLQWLAEP